MLKRLSACIGEYKKDTILSPTFIAMEVVMECLLPLMMSKLIDHLYGEDVLQIVKFGCILLAMAFLSLTFGVLSGMFSSKAAAGFAKNLRRGGGIRQKFKTRSVLSGADLFVWRYRQIFDFQSGYAPYDRRHQRSECVYDDDPYRGTRAVYVFVCACDVVFDQLETQFDFPGVCSSDAGRNVCAGAQG